jgi:hypothetical protein
MWRRIARKRWPWISAAVLVVVAYLSTFVEIHFGSRDPRPLGSAEDI